MRDDLLGYYERELAFLRRMGTDFARRYPKIAARLSLEADKCEDPHVERMIEAFALLAGRVQLKLDDEFPEITESFLNVLYPHYLAPVPSMTIARFALDPQQAKLTGGYQIASDTTLYSRPVQGQPCRFRTSYPVTLFPLEIADAALESLDPVNTRGRYTEAVLRLTLRCHGNLRFSDLARAARNASGTAGEPLDTLRFCLSGEPQLAYPIYEMIFNHATDVEIRASKINRGTQMLPTTGTQLLPANPNARATMGRASIRPVGFEPEEAMLPGDPRVFPGYRLLTEYFAFPEKFLFFDIGNLNRALRSDNFGEQVDLLIRLRDVVPPRAAVDKTLFHLGCTPAINLFTKTAEPILLTHRQHEYRVIADVHRQTATEVYSVDTVTAVDPYNQTARRFQPFYSYRHADNPDGEQAFWYASRRLSQIADDDGTEIYLSLVDTGFNPNTPAAETLTVHTTCTNRDLPARLPFGGTAGAQGDFETEGTGVIARVHAMRKPTAPARPPLRRAAHWRLISHLTLNHLSITAADDDGRPRALQEILMLYDFFDSSATRNQISGLTAINSRRVTRQILEGSGAHIGAGFVRGLETTVEFDEDRFAGGGVYLFASVLERFLGLYVSVNSFNQLVATVRNREGILKRWAPRAGDRQLL